VSSPDRKPFKFSSFLRDAGIDGKASSFAKHQVIFSKGGRNDTLFYIESGSVKLTASSNEGRDAIIGLLDGGNFFGESCMSLNLPVRLHSAIAITETRVLRISREVMVQLLRSEQEASYMFISYLLECIARTQADLASNLVNSSEQRLARLLLSLAHFRSQSNLQFVLSQQSLAEMIGTTRQRVNLLMRRFRNLGFIEDAAGQKVHKSMRSIAPEN
jgi:CRP-like cAMP-binding protein